MFSMNQKDSRFTTCIESVKMVQKIKKLMASNKHSEDFLKIENEALESFIYASFVSYFDGRLEGIEEINNFLMQYHSDYMEMFCG